MLLEAYEDYAKRARLHTSIHAQSGKTEYWRLAESRKSNTQSSPNLNTSSKPADKLDRERKTSSSGPETSSETKAQTSPKPGSNVLTACAINNIGQKRSATEANLETKSATKVQKAAASANNASVDKKKRNLKRL